MKIEIKAKDAYGVTSFYLRFSVLDNAHRAFAAITEDPANQDCNWFLFVDGEELNWHCPLNKPEVR